MQINPRKDAGWGVLIKGGLCNGTAASMRAGRKNGTFNRLNWFARGVRVSARRKKA